MHAVKKILAPGLVHLFGHSFGAMVALAYIEQFGQDEISSLVLAGPLISSPRWKEDQRRLLAGCRRISGRQSRCMSHAKSMVRPANQEVMMEYYRRHVCRMDP
ncbi:alpha/beta fold hydrolase [Methanocalculus sp. MSAO_Arc2]|uniref:alpha/beta fold hydrolase n=1 Tax=Methanocalculus sp. MSAO_Arc2 TaxID=2293855 RepID=UPI0032180C0F